MTNPPINLSISVVKLTKKKFTKSEKIIDRRYNFCYLYINAGKKSEGAKRKLTEANAIMPPYVRQSAMLKCTMGSAQSAMQLSHPVSPVLLCGSPMAGMADIKPVANLAPFGLCKSLANPAVAAATAAAGGKLQEMPCVPCVTVPWAYAKMNVWVKGQPALTDDSRCVCMWLGIIKVKSAGQKSVTDTAPPPFIPEEPPPPAAAPEAKDGKAKAAKTPPKGFLSSIKAAVAAAIEKVVDAVKDRITAVASSVAAALTAAVGGIFGLRGKGDHTEADTSQDAATADIGEEADSAASEVKTTITAKLIRYYFNAKRTIGTLQVFRGDEQLFKCYTCEDTVRGDGNPDTVKEWKIKKETAIPYGKYICTREIRQSKGKYAWLVTNVPEYTGIWIHHGNTEKDTEGCLLLGMRVAPDYSMIQLSDVAIAEFEKHIADYGNQDFELEITKDFSGAVAKSEELISKESKYAATSARISIKEVKGPQSASFGQKAEYCVARYSTDNVSEETRKKVRWAVSVDGKQEEQKTIGEKITIEIKKEWAGKNIIVMACMNSFSTNVSQRTTVAVFTQTEAGQKSAQSTKKTAMTAQSSTPTTANTPATTASTASGKYAGGTQTAEVKSVSGPKNASIGQKAEYLATFNTSDVSDELRRSVRWGVNEVGTINPEELKDKGDKITLEIREEWASLNIRVTACINNFDKKVGQKTKIAQHPQVIANRAKACAACAFRKEMKGDCQHVNNIYGHPITDLEYDKSAKNLDIDAALMKAIGSNESGESGFFGEGVAKILFERHYMYNGLSNKYGVERANELAKKYPLLVNKEPNVVRSNSCGKLKLAKEIDTDCAIRSCSWGRYQIMGETFKYLYSSPTELELAMNACELHQFNYFVQYLKKKPKMIDALKAKDWEKIAYLYNGSNWKNTNPNYATNLEKNYNKFKTIQ